TILDHLEKLTAERNTAVIFITHDLGLAAERAENLVVMHRGRIVESGPALEILQNPQHPYTQRLVSAAPSLASKRIQSAAGARTPIQSHDRGDKTGEFSLDIVAEKAAESAGTSESVIEFRDVTKVYNIRGGGFRSTPFTAVDAVSFTVPRGSTMALVGESGSGKSTAAKLLLRLEEKTSGKIYVDGKDIDALKGAELLALRRKMQPVFQDPYGSLDPLHN